MAQTGRPSGYSEQLADTILDRICSGQSLVSICRDDGMPSPSMVFRWLTGNSPDPKLAAAYATFRDRYAHARTVQAETKFEQISDIAQRVIDGEIDPNAGRVAIDAHKWQAAKLAPAKYGDRIEHVLKPARVEDMTDEELARIAGTAMLLTHDVTDQSTKVDSTVTDETPPEYPGNKGGGGVADG